MDVEQEPTERDLSEVIYALKATGLVRFSDIVRRLAFQRDSLAAEVQRLREELQQQKETRSLIAEMLEHEPLADRLADLETAIVALRHYADKSSWAYQDESGFCDHYIGHDEGCTVAQQALAKLGTRETGL